jgi:hypothetical protein
VAIPPEAVEVIGVLPPSTALPPGGHYGLQYHASVDEVSAVFEMPLEEALRLGAIIRWIFSVGA